MRNDDLFNPEIDGDEVAGSIEEWSEDAPEAHTLSLPPNDVLRIEEVVGTRWSGVASCCDQSRVNAEAKAAFEAWVQRKMFEYRHLRWIRYGPNGQATGRCSSSDGGSTGRRCSAYLNIPAFIEFRRA